MSQGRAPVLAAPWRSGWPHGARTWPYAILIRAGLDETLTLLDDFNVKTRADFLDVSNRDGVFAYADVIQDHFGQVNVVFNNAGAALNGEFENTSLDDLEWQMNVNFWGVANGTKAFLPKLQAAEWGHITNISSLFGADRRAGKQRL